MPKEQVIKKSALSPTVLIAGGAGFIGSHLAETLLEKDARVIVLDNFRTGKDIYINSLLDNPKFALFDVDINQGIPQKIESVDYIFHLAGVETYLYNRDNVNLDSLLTNALGTKNLLDLAQKSGAKLLLVSSVDVYQGRMSPIDIEHYFGQTVEEEQKYSISEAKRFAEALVWEYHKKNQTDARIVRIPETYGPKMNLNSSGNLGRLLKELMEKNKLTVYGEGTEKEYYLYISDAVSGITKALFDNNTKGKIYTLAPQEPHAILETTYLVKSLAHGDIPVEFKTQLQMSKGESVFPDLSSLKDLKWEPKVSFKDGIAKTLKWFGYDPNEMSFKPAKLIKDKEESKGTITTLQQEPTEEKQKPDKRKRKMAVSLKNLLPKIRKEKEKEFPTPKPIKSLKKAKIKIREKHYFEDEKPSKPLLEGRFFTSGVTVKYISIKWFHISIFIVLAFIIFAFVPLIQAYIHTKTAGENLKTVPSYITSMEADKAKDASNKAFQEFHKAQMALKRAKWVFAIVGKKEEYKANSKLLSSATYLAKSAYYTSKASNPFTSIWNILKPTSEVEFDENLFSQSKLNLSDAKNSLQLAQAEFKEVDTDKVTPKVKDLMDEYKIALDVLSEGLELGTALASEIPNLLGSYKPAKYLILFQNSNEIRPTGGFIGSYAVIHIDKGKITSIVIDDIYNPDGQIDTRNIITAPPQPIAEALGEDRTYIRNSNWNPDFTKSAKDIENLFFKVTGDRFDGVVAIDLHFVQNLLNVTGPLFLTAYNEEISSQNLYERTQYHSGFNYTDGSDQKRSFLTILGSKLLEKMFAIPNENMPNFLLALQKSLTEKHLLVQLNSSSFNAKLETRGWNGQLIKTEGDYLYIVNANLGGTKANYYVKNSMEYNILSKTRDGLLRAALILTYQHTQEDNSWPGGPYTNYVRVLTQEGSNLTGAELIKGEKTSSIFDKVIIDKYGSYTSYETKFILQPQETVQIALYYDLSKNISITKSRTEYNLLWQKQPGTQEDLVNFAFEPPFGMELAEGNERYEGALNKDLIISLKVK